MGCEMIITGLVHVIEASGIEENLEYIVRNNVVTFEYDNMKFIIRFINETLVFCTEIILSAGVVDSNIKCKDYSIYIGLSSGFYFESYFNVIDIIDNEPVELIVNLDSRNCHLEYNNVGTLAVEYSRHTVYESNFYKFQNAYKLIGIPESFRCETVECSVTNGALLIRTTDGYIRIADDNIRVSEETDSTEVGEYMGNPEKFVCYYKEHNGYTYYTVVYNLINSYRNWEQYVSHGVVIRGCEVVYIRESDDGAVEVSVLGKRLI